MAVVQQSLISNFKTFLLSLKETLYFLVVPSLWQPPSVHLFLFMVESYSILWIMLCIVYPSQWTFGWFLFFTVMKCYEHSCTPVCVDVDFHFCQVYTQEWSFWVIWELLSDELLNSFPKCTILHCHKQCMEVSISAHPQHLLFAGICC